MEAPPGYGKSWLVRRAAAVDVLRLRGELGPLASGTIDGASTIVIDDGHQLSVSDTDRLAECIEDAQEGQRLIIAGRILPDSIHEAAHLVDGLIIDADALTIDADEVLAELEEPSLTLARQIVDAADGSVRVIATSLGQSRRELGSDPIAVASRMVRVASAAALQHLGAHDQAVIALLARTPGIDRYLLDKLAGAGFVDRSVAAGGPRRRQVTGAFDLAAAAAVRAAPPDPHTAAELAVELLERDRPFDAVGLLLDAGDYERATQMVMGLSESITETVEPRQMLSLLARLGPTTEREPLLLLLRASAVEALGRVDEAGADIERAMAMAVDAAPSLRHRIAIESARADLSHGRREEAMRIAQGTLSELGDGETRTYARAHELLAQCASTFDAREDLQNGAESYRVAATAWESCGEFARARACRRDLALGVLAPLGRFDEGLAQLSQLLSTPDLSDAERSWTVLVEGFVLFNANRLDSADARFARVTDLGYILDNPRLIAAAAWGRALTACRRGDRAATLRWIATAENTALGETDDVLGVPFLCDTVMMLGMLGELDLATAYLGRAAARNAVFPGQIRSTAFVLDARKGVLGDIDQCLAQTVPLGWWQVKLVAALAAAHNGDVEQARMLLHDATHELVTLGFSDFAALGEGRTYGELQAALQRVAKPASAAAPAPTSAAASPTSPTSTERRLIVMGTAISISTGAELTVVPPGNPQRLVGVIVANGGSVSIDQLSEALWPKEELEISRSRLRNVLLRLRRAVGDVVVRSGAGLRLVPGLACDFHDFQRLAVDALAAVRADPDLAGRLAVDAVAIGDASLFVDFEYDEWAVSARRSAEQQLISLLDLLSVQAEDIGDFPAAQAFAERALRFDRYADSRYVRLAELLTLQNRVAAAIAVLDDAAEVARDMGGSTGATKGRRDDLMRRTAATTTT
ncbi:MAG: bacterial transcriptional activator domain-containing protein [Ilumatobacteraceae bacterium]